MSPGMSLGQLLDDAVILLDLHCHVGDLMKQRAERNGQTGRHHRKASFSKAQCRRGGKAVAAWLRQSTDRVHCAGSQARQHIERESASVSPAALPCDGQSDAGTPDRAARNVPASRRPLNRSCDHAKVSHIDCDLAGAGYSNSVAASGNSQPIRAHRAPINIPSKAPPKTHANAIALISIELMPLPLAAGDILITVLQPIPNCHN